MYDTTIIHSHHRERVQHEQARVGADARVPDGLPDVVRQTAVDDALAEPQCAPDQQEEGPIDVRHRLFRVYPAPEDEDSAGCESPLDLGQRRQREKRGAGHGQVTKSIMVPRSVTNDK